MARLPASACRPDSDPGDRGSVALIIAVFTVAMFAMTGLVIDGGAALAARGRATDVARQAARAGADEVTADSLRAGDPSRLQINPLHAQQAAQSVLTTADATGDIHIVGQSVTVTARIRRRSVVLSAFGVTDLTGTGSATASLLYGTTTPSPG